MKAINKFLLFTSIFIIFCGLMYQAESSDISKEMSMTDTTFTTGNKRNMITLTDENASEENTQSMTNEENEQVPGTQFQSGSEAPALEFIQYRLNAVKNITGKEMVVTTSSGSKDIPPGGEDSVLIGGEESVSVSLNGTEDKYQVKQNQKPKMVLQALYNLSSDEIHLKRLQAITGYRIIIKDDYADQLEIKITGPVKYDIAERTDSGIVINVKLNAFSTERAFDNYANRIDKERYSAGFNVTVKDKYAPHKLSQMGVFYFTEW
jgi:hypothetical protein